ncbi:MAG: hypothetical protein JWQ43_2415 [Glaciihabitans sp.]|nr:hypothetical protein [Glaciihabitans sp.]
MCRFGGYPIVAGAGASYAGCMTSPETQSAQVASKNPYATQIDPDARILGLLSLIGGIASIVFGQTIILPVAAIILGFMARRREVASRTFATWGIALGFLALFGWVIVIILGVIFATPFFLFSIF